ncbi:SDR family NAD(P)-dependent oxidoreductase [Azospirillum picis]|uniref:3-oxoacyl-[acyl-carrier protein] reductase n=1 Tax=Azospirillum picis TaxID=488438 RepID=A0ABU0MRB3_9PROT|nr:SDR family oxidoreductase [Azospirillum picis]MBP2302149.1 3-oxoacyl-[acyl-carrier protein] reductase [Azospirillum picis]MDQ0535728.1 3-oxoacyl-[acyl-carrier protein] reductase [Azospirillum picis]
MTDTLATAGSGAPSSQTPDWPADLLGREFAGKRVLVTGSSRGIGAAVAAAFAQLGARVAIHGRDPAAVEAAAAAMEQGAGQGTGRGTAVGVVPLAGDFADRAQVRAVVEQAVERLGGLDVLINNAGTMLGRVTLADIDDDFLQRQFDLNAASSVVASRAALPALTATKGSIINTGSISGRTGGSPGSSLYSAAKAFQASLARSLATELAPHGIRVNAVSPGTVATDFHERYSTPEKLAQTAARIPLKRLGTAGDCVGAYLFLASGRLAGYVTGQVIEVNGGQFYG